MFNVVSIFIRSCQPNSHNNFHTIFGECVLHDAHMRCVGRCSRYAGNSLAWTDRPSNPQSYMHTHIHTPVHATVVNSLHVLPQCWEINKNKLQEEWLSASICVCILQQLCSLCVPLGTTCPIRFPPTQYCTHVKGLEKTKSS